MKTIFRIIRYASDWKKQLIIAAVTMLMVTGINLAAPALIRQLFEILENPGADPVKSIAVISAVLLGLYILRVFIQFLNSYCAHIAAWKSVAKLRGTLYGHMQGLSMRFYRDKQTGQLMSRVIEDTANFEMLIAHALPELITSVLVLIGVLIILFIMNPVLAALTCIPVPFILVCSMFLKKMRLHFSERQKRSAELNAMLADNFSGMKEIQVFNRQTHERGRVERKAREHVGSTLKGLYWVAWLHPSVAFISGLGTVIVICAGGLLAYYNKGMNIADISVYLLYLNLFYAPVAAFSRIFEDVQTAIVSGKRVFEILDEESDVRDLPGARETGRLSGQVSFDRVSFEYDKEVAILKNISFDIAAGKVLALVGPTGSGKSTLISLIARFYDADCGVISMDGIDTKDMTLHSLREQMSIVLQDVFLFNGTIAENIAYGREGATNEEVYAAARAACIHDFIAGLEKGYETVIGERGVRLSGGQKQRIAIARAVLRGAPILILDEATSAVDNETESEIQDAIDKIAGMSTIIIIAHRLSTVKRADEILYLSAGEIIERGTHEELMAKKGAYFSQF